jgi:hypothetical protein
MGDVDEVACDQEDLVVLRNMMGTVLTHPTPGISPLVRGIAHSGQIRRLLLFLS